MPYHPTQPVPDVMPAPMGPPLAGGLEARVDRRDHGQRAVDLRAYADDGPLVGLSLPVYYQDAARVVAARAARLAEQATVRVRCTGADGRRAMHTIRLEGGRLRLLDHPRAGRRADQELYARAPVRPPRCVEVLSAWRSARAYRRSYRDGRRRNYGDWRDSYDVWWQGSYPGESDLPAGLRTIRKQQVGQGAVRADYREWLGFAAGAAAVRGGQIAQLLVRLEYAWVREQLLLPAAPARLPVTAGALGDRSEALGVTWDERDEDDPDRTAQRAGLSLNLGRDWLRRLYWQGRGVVDGRVVLDVERDPATGRTVAVLIGWGGRYSGMGDDTTTPGDVTTATSPLYRDAAGRWHLADPTAGTHIRTRDR